MSTQGLGGTPKIPGYEIDQLLGAGGRAFVFGACAEANGRRVAIKVAREDSEAHRREIEREAEVLRWLAGRCAPHLAEVQLSGAPVPYLVMEAIVGSPLASVIGERASESDRASLTKAVVETFVDLHAAGVLHGDVSPANILVRDSSAVALVDFALSRIVDAEGEFEHTAGTALYSPPERFGDEPFYDQRSEVYSLGATIYHVLAGRPPFSGNLREVTLGHTVERVPLMGASNPALERVILRCLAKSRDARFASMAELREALGEALAQPVQVTSARPARVAQATYATRLLGLVYCGRIHSRRDLQAAAKAANGVIVQQGDGCTVLVGAQGAQAPIEVAFAVARRLIRSKACESVSVGLEALEVRSRRRGFSAKHIPAAPSIDSLRLHGDVPLSQKAWRALQRRGIVEAWGQEALLEELQSEILRTGRGSLVLLHGPARCGKTTLQSSLANRLHQLSGWRVEEFSPGSFAPEPDPVVQLIAVLVPLAKETAPASSDPDDVRAAVQSMCPLDDEKGWSNWVDWPALALAMGWLDARSRPVRDLLAVPGRFQEALAFVLAQGLRAICARGPTLFSLDGIDELPEPLVRAAELLSTDKSVEGYFAVVGSAREGTRPHWDRTMWKGIAVCPLSDQELREYIRHLLLPVTFVSQETVDDLAVICGGSAEHARQLVDLLWDAHAIVRSGKTWKLDDSKIREIEHSELHLWLAESASAKIPAALLAHCRFYAEMGGLLIASELEEISTEAELEGADLGLSLDHNTALEWLSSYGVLRLTEGNWRFENELVRNALAQQLPRSVAEVVHRAALGFYSRFLTSGRRRAERLAHHATEAGEASLAAAMYELQARQADDEQRWADVAVAVGGWLSQVEPGSESEATARYLRGRARLRLGLLEQANADLAAAGGLANDIAAGSLELEARLEEATVLDWLYRWDESEKATQKALSLVNQSTELQFARLLLAQARSLWRKDRHAEAIPLFEKCIRHCTTIGDQAFETQVIALMLLGHIRLARGEFEHSNRSNARVIELCRKHNDRLHLTAALSNGLEGLAETGRLSEIVARAEEGLKLARIGGNAKATWALLYNLCECLHWAGRVELVTVWRPRLLSCTEALSDDAAACFSALLDWRIGIWLREDVAAVETARPLLDRVSAVLPESELRLLAAMVGIFESPLKQNVRTLAAKLSGVPLIEAAWLLAVTFRERDERLAQAFLQVALDSLGERKHLIRQGISRIVNARSEVVS